MMREKKRMRSMRKLKRKKRMNGRKSKRNNLKQKEKKNNRMLQLRGSHQNDWKKKRKCPMSDVKLVKERLLRNPMYPSRLERDPKLKEKPKNKKDIVDDTNIEKDFEDTKIQTLWDELVVMVDFRMKKIKAKFIEEFDSAIES
ncbi:hypothetical protein M9H77_12228 [Catharanthus roseus]|uniref:Uncharacterized protein n=1 Tax=Catharanthus roseus TaxID=4058 RepID=A0ACC0BGU2_CATRO|nr:hypothetical protein M9H77_12228 [Catharanthus roseus]